MSTLTTPSTRFARSLAFVLNNGTVVYPIRRINRQTWRKTFRLALAAEALDDIIEVEEEQQLLQLIMRHHCCVRCSTIEGTHKGMFGVGARLVRQVLLHDSGE